MDVGDLSNHVKYCVSVCLASNGKLSEHHRSAHRRAGIPNNWYQNRWFKVVFDFFLKNESCQNCVLTIPLCRGGRDEATGANGIEIGRRTWPHVPSWWLSTRADARHASSSPGWVDPTRIPVDLTHVTDPKKDDVSMT